MSARTPWTRRGLVLGYILIAAGLTTAGLLSQQPVNPILAISLIAGVVSCAAGGALVLGRHTFSAVAALVVASAAGLWATAIKVLDNPSKDIRPIALEIARQRRDGERVVVLGRLESVASVAFYLKTPVVVASAEFGELQMARDAPEAGEASRFSDTATAERWMRPDAGRTFFVGYIDTYEAYYRRQPGLALHEVARHGRWVAWTNR